MFLLRDHMVHIVTGSLFVGLLECSRPKVPPPSQKKRNREADFAPAGCKFCRCLNSILRCLVDLGWRSKGDTSFAGSLLMISHHRKLQPIASFPPVLHIDVPSDSINCHVLGDFASCFNVLHLCLEAFAFHVQNSFRSLDGLYCHLSISMNLRQLWSLS